MNIELNHKFMDNLFMQFKAVFKALFFFKIKVSLLKCKLSKSYLTFKKMYVFDFNFPERHELICNIFYIYFFIHNIYYFAFCALKIFALFSQNDFNLTFLIIIKL